MADHCWEEYMWKVHKAVPVDPWASNVELLDVMIAEKPPSFWPPAWLFKRKLQLPHALSRAGSMFTLAAGEHSSKPKVSPAGDASLVPQGDNNNNTGSTPNGDINNTIIRKEPRAAGQANHIRKHSLSSAEPILKTLSIRASPMPDIQASIKSSSSLLASITAGSSASAQFHVKGSKTVTCSVGGVVSQSVDLDALMEMVTPRRTFDDHDCFDMAPWQPDISLPQLKARPKRGQTLWVVTEILHANFIKIEGDNLVQATNKVKLAKGAEGADVSGQVETEKDGVWTVTAPKDNPTFPFGLRLQRLKYDANGSLVTSNNKYLKRNSSLRI